MLLFEKFSKSCVAEGPAGADDDDDDSDRDDFGGDVDHEDIFGKHLLHDLRLLLHISVTRFTVTAHLTLAMLKKKEEEQSHKLALGQLRV